MKLHAIVDDLAVAERAARGGATVLQLRLKNAPTSEVVARGRAFAELARAAAVTFVVNDDVEAALALHADGVHLGRDDSGGERALDAGLLLGLSAATLDEAVTAEAAGAAYVGAGPVWATPSKHDADPPIGLGGLATIVTAVSVPVVAIGGIDAGNVRECVRAGASGVAVIRAAEDSAALRAALDEALTAR